MLIAYFGVMMLFWLRDMRPVAVIVLKWGLFIIRIILRSPVVVIMLVARHVEVHNLFRPEVVRILYWLFEM